MKRTVIVNCQVYKKNTPEQKFPKLETTGKEFRIELDESLLDDESKVKTVLTKMVHEKSTDMFRCEYFNHVVQDYTIEKLGSQRDFINLKNTL